MLLSGPYYRSLSYELTETEIVARMGVWTHSVKHVPYRTITNVTLKRGLLDRWFGIGRLDVQTAGMSGSSGVEASLVGLDDVQAVYDAVAARVRHVKGGMAPTASEEEARRPDYTAPTSEVLSEILDELRAIRRLLSRDE